MCKATDVANFFISVSLTEKEDYITNLKLNKLMYYAQGWSLARLGKPLFQSDIQAWKYGPVVPSVYHDYKNCGYSPITVVADDYSNSCFSGEQLTLLHDVYAEYGRFTGQALTFMTHNPGTPWSQCYMEGENKVIPKQVLADYFSSLPKLRSFRDIEIPESHILGHYDDKLGYYVLPKEEDDEDEYDI